MRSCPQDTLKSELEVLSVQIKNTNQGRFRPRNTWSWQEDRDSTVGMEPSFLVC